MGKQEGTARRRGLGVLGALGMLAATLATVTVVLVAPAPASADVAQTVASSFGLGANHNCTVTTAGGVKCWGNNVEGELGNGTNTNSITPVDVTGLTSGVAAVGSGRDVSCALTTAGGVKCWGTNTNGMLGKAGITGSNVPVDVTGLTSGVKAIDVGELDVCAITDAGAAKCWGSNGSNQLGSGQTGATLLKSEVPLDVVGLSSGVTAISAGGNRTCALLTSGAVKCWGKAPDGIGDGVSTDAPAPVAVLGLGSGVASVSAGSSHVCVVTTAGALKCWGTNNQGQTTGAAASYPTPIDADGFGSGVASVEAGADATCVVTTTKAASCWGANTTGQLGSGNAANNAPPTTPFGLGSGVARMFLSPTGGYGCAILTTGAATCMGTVNNFQTLNGTTNTLRAPQLMSGPALGAASLSAGSTTTCAVTTAGGGRCWGLGNANGLLGTGVATLMSYAPVTPVGYGSGVAQISVWGTATHACARTTAGGAQCWGTGTSGRLGNGTTTTSASPVDVTGLTSGVAGVAVGGTHSCALTTGGAVKCWGLGANGALGNGSNLNASTPVDVTGLSSGVASIAAGGGHVCAVTTGGGVKCWGSNSSGQVGDNGTTTTRTPVDVPELTSGVAAISLGNTHSCALTTAGGVKCWGGGTLGQLGNGVTGSSRVVVDVTGLSSGVTAISAGSNHTCALLSDGTVRCWGLNSTGQLGIGTNVNQNTPQQVQGISDATAIAAGNAHTCAVVTGGAVKCWGLDSSNQLGVPNPVWTPNTAPIGTTIGPVQNTAPVAVAQAISAPRGVAKHILLAATDGESDPLTFAVDDQPTKGVLDCNGTSGEDCTYTAGPGQSGSDSFTFHASDGTLSSDIVTVSITITNQAPTGDPITLSAPRGVATPVLLTGADPNSDPITFAVVDQPTKGSVSCNAAGTCSYTANAGATGTDSFTYSVSDGSLTSAANATATITITNQAPVADARTLDAGRGVATPVVLTAVDPNGDPLTFSIVDQPTKGTLSCTGDGSSCTYTSEQAETGSDSFTFTASDGDLTSSVKTVAITLVNAAPTANAQTLQAPRGVATAIALSGADPEGDGLTFAVDTSPTKGSVTCTGTDGSSCSYTADPGARGADSFTFHASDGTTDSAPATVTLSITNQAPTANAQVVAANAPTTATPITLSALDPNGDTLSYAVKTLPAKGTVSCTGTSCTYVTKPGRTGTDSFTFEVTDIDGATSVATVSLNLDNATPGVFLGDTDMLEPETNNATTLQGPNLPVTLSRTSSSAITVWYWTSNGTAVAQGINVGDYRTWGTATAPRSVTIAAGSLQAVISPPVYSDDLVETDEAFDVHLVAITGGAAYAGDDTGTVTIHDSDTGTDGTPMLELDGANVAEGNAGTRLVPFRVNLSRPSSTPLTITYATANGTGVAGRDYTRKTGTVTIPAGRGGASIDVGIPANVTAQADRTFRLEISVTGADANVVRASAVATVFDED